MKKDGKYRFSLQFGSDSDEQVQVGELLERLGNKKSHIIVAAVSEYIHNHPEIQGESRKIEVKITSSYSKDKIEEIIRKVLEERLASMQVSTEGINKNSEYDEVAMENDIAQMLDNIDAFE